MRVPVLYTDQGGLLHSPLSHVNPQTAGAVPTAVALVAFPGTKLEMRKRERCPSIISTSQDRT